MQKGITKNSWFLRLKKNIHVGSLLIYQLLKGREALMQSCKGSLPFLPSNDKTLGIMFNSQKCVMMKKKIFFFINEASTSRRSRYWKSLIVIYGKYTWRQK